jgi:LPXTG-motif cell wall-anchored protein
MVLTRRTLASLAAVVLLAGTAARSSAQLQDLTQKGRERLWVQTKPAVVLVWTSLSADINVVGPTDATITGITMPQGDQLLLTLHAEMSVFGSGWIITPDGYIVTNGHVVQLYHEQNEQQLQMELFYAALEASGFFEREEVIRGGGPGAPLTQDHKIRLMQRLLPYANIQINKDLDVYLQNWRSFAARVSQYSGPIYPFKGRVAVPGVTLATGRDVAILKIERQGGADFPTVRIGDSERMALGNNISVGGYPGTASFNDYLDPREQMQATFTDGTVSSLKVLREGNTLIQISAAIAAGNSGGPVINDAGEVIGMATLGAEPGFNFAVPTSTVNEFIRDAGVAPASGLFDQYWSEALDHYYNGESQAATNAGQARNEYQLAINGFDEVLRLMPDLPDAVRLRQEGLRRRDELPQTGPSSLPMIVGAVVVLGLLLVGLGLWMRRRAPGAAAAAPASGGRRDGRTSGRLIVTAGPLQGNSFPVGPQGLKIGRDPASCQIVLSEPTVSREHAQLYVSGTNADFQIRNLSGTNATYVNDRAIQEATLRPGDRIKIGNSVLSFEKN